MANREEIARESITHMFLPTFSLEPIKSPRRFNHDSCEYWAKQLLGTDDIYRKPAMTSEDTDMVLQRRRHEYYSVHEKYTNFFNLCRVIGAKNIYDIGCNTVHQSYILANPYTTMSYTGIEEYAFKLIDYLPNDYEDEYTDVMVTYDTPAPLYNGRIKYVKGSFPSVPLDVQPNNIAIASCSLMMLTDERDIEDAFEALKEKFERFVITVPNPLYAKEKYEMWKKQDWSGYEICPVGNSHVFATKNPEDIKRLREVYQYNSEKNAYLCGIDGHMRDHLRTIESEENTDKFEYYINF